MGRLPQSGPDTQQYDDIDGILNHLAEKRDMLVHRYCPNLSNTHAYLFRMNLPLKATHKSQLENVEQMKEVVNEEDTQMFLVNQKR